MGLVYCLVSCDEKRKRSLVLGAGRRLFVRSSENTGKNEYVTLDKSIVLTCDLAKAVARAEIIIISISSQGLRGFIEKIKACGDVSEKYFVLCMKGIEVETGERLSQILIDAGIAKERIAVWVGPGHIQDFTAGIPN